MALFKPKKPFDRRGMIEDILRDLDPSLREEARRLLENLPQEQLLNKEYVRRFLRKKGLLK